MLRNQRCADVKLSSRGEAACFLTRGMNISFVAISITLGTWGKAFLFKAENMTPMEAKASSGGSSQASGGWMFTFPSPAAGLQT